MQFWFQFNGWGRTAAVLVSNPIVCDAVQVCLQILPGALALFYGNQETAECLGNTLLSEVVIAQQPGGISVYTWTVAIINLD